MTLTQLPAQFNIKAQAASNFGLAISFYQNDMPMDLTTLENIIFGLKRNPEDAAYQKVWTKQGNELSVQGSILVINLAASELSELQGLYHFDVRFIYPNPPQATVLSQVQAIGKISFNNSITVF
jgi:hypothetical protein